jgi:hypothetical protein
MKARTGPLVIIFIYIHKLLCQDQIYYYNLYNQVVMGINYFLKR